MKKKIILLGIPAACAAVFLILFGCSDESVIASTETIPTPYQKIYGAYDIYNDGDYVVIKVLSRPEHKSPYYAGTQWQNTLYEAYNGSNPNYAQNPHRIAEANLTFRIPKNPQVSSTHSSTPMGPIGVSLNGVPFYNQYAGGGQPLTGEINSFDQYNGHPAPSNMYHYHAEPTYITSVYGKSGFLGFLLDGFPVYGPEENGQAVTNADLDAYHGHTHATKEYPNGIYHYHTTTEAPYINGDGFYGTPGTVTQ